MPHELFQCLATGSLATGSLGTPIDRVVKIVTGSSIEGLPYAEEQFFLHYLMTKSPIRTRHQNPGKVPTLRPCIVAFTMTSKSHPHRLALPKIIRLK